ncbi:MAG: hypothetical protein QGG83_01270, partial [Candidatus Woesearchaeota archaeon]|nr:hypothetical protein [Candidatus Woesearchaeota archaeon]
MHKDALYHGAKNHWRRDVRSCPALRAADLKVQFGTLDEIFPGAIPQPVMYSENLQHVLSQQKVHLQGGFCPVGAGRISVNQGGYLYDVWDPPIEVMEGGGWSVQERYADMDVSSFLARPKWDVSGARLEPTLGRVAKMFKMLDAASHIGEELEVAIPTEVYVGVRAFNANRIGLRGKVLESTLQKVQQRYEHTLVKIRDEYFPKLQLTFTFSADPTPELADAAVALADISQHQKQGVAKQYVVEELQYLAFLALHPIAGRPTVVLQHYEDVESFLSQAYAAVQYTTAKAWDTFAFLGLTSGPAIHKQDLDGYMLPTMQESSSHDYFAPPPQVLSLWESRDDSWTKITQPYSDRGRVIRKSSQSPVFAFLNTFHPFVGDVWLGKFLDKW